MKASRILTSALITCLAASSVLAQEEWTIKMKPTQLEQLSWALEGGVGFSIGDHIIFGMGRRNDGEVTSAFRKYHPASNTFSGFGPGSQLESGFSAFYAGEGAIGFSMGDVGYAGLGGRWNWDANDTIFRYTVADDHFWSLPPLVFPGGKRIGAIAFVIGDKAYIGGGSNPGWSEHKDLWEYSAATGWTQRANMPANIERGTSFALDGKGYVISSAGTQLWCYDPAMDTWTTKAPYPGGSRIGAVAFAKDGKGWVGTGIRNGTERTPTFFAYDPASDSWSPALPMWDPWGRSDAVAVMHGGKAYVIGGKAGLNSDQPVAEIWELGPTTALVPGTWVQRPYLPAAPRERPVTFVINDILYLGGGKTQNGNWLTELWSYDPGARTWTPRTAMPSEALAGAQVAAAANGKGYMLINATANNFWAYDPGTDQWSPRADMPGGGRSRPVGFGLDGRIFIGTGTINGVRQKDLWAYDPQTNSWEQRTDMNGSGVTSAAAFAVGNKGCIYGGNISGTTTHTSAFKCYDPLTDSWSTGANVLLPNQIHSHMAFGIGDQGYRAGGVVSATTLADAFHSYDLGTNAWTVEETTGGGWRRDGAAAGAAGFGFLSCGSVNPNNDSPTSASATLSNDLWQFVPTNYQENPGITISTRAFLGGPYDEDAGTMQDQLRASGLIPLTEPYTALGYTHVSGGGETTTSTVLAAIGNNAIVDWVVLELRSASNSSSVLATRSGLVQRDGDVVDVDGVSPVSFTVPPGNYHIAIRHRNHLGCMSANAIALSSTPAVLDLSSPTTATWGSNARKNINGNMVLWAGDCRGDGDVKYVGANNDRDAILLLIGGVVPTGTVAGYHKEDANMDGQVKYSGANNDRDVILVNIGGTVPTNVVMEQLP